MKLNNIFFVFGIFLFFTMCKTNKTNKDCEKFIEKYTMFRSLQNNDSTFYYIDKVIECSDDKDFYKFGKINFLISLKKYQKALLEFDRLKMNNTDDYILLRAVLELKLNNPNSKKTLNEAYLKYNKLKEDSNGAFYQIALINYFEGKSLALENINKQKVNFKNDAYALQNFDLMKNLINNQSKEDVLYSIFNIDLDDNRDY